MKRLFLISFKLKHFKLYVTESKTLAKMGINFEIKKSCLFVIKLKKFYRIIYEMYL